MKKFINLSIRSGIVLIFGFLFTAVILNSCKKDSSLSTADQKTLLKLKSETLLSKNSADLSSRLDVIKNEFLKRKLDAKFAPKNENDFIWTPQWANPKIQTVNDSVSYVFYHLKPQAKWDGKMIDVKEVGAVSYIMVKNETEFYEAFFYLPSNLRSKTPSNDTPESFMGKFTGKLLLTNLENKQNFLLDYKDGRVSDTNKKQLLASRKLLAVRGATAYTQEECTTVTLGCSFATNGRDGCGEEGPQVVYREDCMYPNSCGYWTLTDRRTQTTCVMVNYPDPPVDPNDPDGTGGIGGTGELPSDIKHKLDSFPCAKSLVLEMPNLNTEISILILNAFNKHNRVNLTVESNPSLAGTSVDGQLGTSSQFTYQGTLNYNISIGINPDVLKHATKEFILVTIYHEAIHAYLALRKQELGQTEFDNQFMGIYVNGGRLLGVQDPQHWSMGYTKFVNGLRDVILAYNPSFDTNRAYAMALGGINTLTPSQLAVNNQEKDTRVVGYTGTKCP